MKELWVEKYRPSKLDGYVFRDSHQKEQEQRLQVLNSQRENADKLASQGQISPDLPVRQANMEVRCQLCEPIFP